MCSRVSMCVWGFAGVSGMFRGVWECLSVFRCVQGCLGVSRQTGTRQQNNNIMIPQSTQPSASAWWSLECWSVRPPHGGSSPWPVWPSFSVTLLGSPQREAGRLLGSACLFRARRHLIGHRRGDGLREIFRPRGPCRRCKPQDRGQQRPPGRWAEESALFREALQLHGAAFAFRARGSQARVGGRSLHLPATL